MEPLLSTSQACFATVPLLLKCRLGVFSTYNPQSCHLEFKTRLNQQVCLHFMYRWLKKRTISSPAKCLFVTFSPVSLSTFVFIYYKNNILLAHHNILHTRSVSEKWINSSSTLSPSPVIFSTVRILLLHCFLFFRTPTLTFLTSLQLLWKNPAKYVSVWPMFTCST